MKPKSKASVSPLEHYWLIAGQVHYTHGEGHKFHRNLNCLIRTDRQAFAHVNMAKAQQLLQMRLMNETFAGGPPEGFQIIDVFLMNVSHLGRMTPEEFSEGFAALATEQNKAEEILEKLRNGVAAN